MTQELSATLSPSAAAGTRTATGLRFCGIVLTGSALVAVCAHLALPLYFTPVPLSMAPFAVLLLGLLLSPRLAAASLTAYLVEGALGLPVFAPASTTGLLHFLGPAGGYLLAYPMAAFLVSFLWRRSQRGFAAAACCAALGNLAILTSGALWLGILTHAAPRALLTLAVLPFLPGDALKVFAAAALAAGLQRLHRKTA